MISGACRLRARTAPQEWPCIRAAGKTIPRHRRRIDFFEEKTTRDGLEENP